jgi:NAD(P)H-hydrate repair Nnr-like enzyme with NAD(P)H-hydrate dehydratase domain
MLYVNPLGTPVLSQAGSGDVLSGIVASLLAQGFTPLNAAIQGSLAHALAARRYRGANYSATAEDLIEELRWLGT